MFPRVRLLLLCCGIPALIGLAITAIVGMLLEGSANYEIQFRAAVDGRALTCGHPIDGIGEAKISVALVDFRFTVSNVELIRYDGKIFPLALEQDGIWQIGKAASLDLEDASGSCVQGTPVTRREVRGSAPKGNYRGVRFVLGGPDGVNPADPAIAPRLSTDGMQPEEQGNHHALRIELATVVAGEGTAPPTSQAARTVFRIPRLACPPTTGSGVQCGADGAIQVALNDVQPNRHVIIAEVGGLISESILGEDASSRTRECEPTSVDSTCVEALRRLGFADGGKVGRAHLFFFAQARR
ncbi:MAG: MbnP family protein [Burkholderiales bacterium]